MCQGSRRAPRSWDYLHNVCILSSRSCFIFIFEAQRGCWVFVWFFFLPLHATLSLGFSPATVSTTSPSHCPTMARMNRPAPVEVCYKNMRFLITHNPTNATLSTFLEVRREGWKRGTRVQLHLLGLKADVDERAAHPLWYHSPQWHPGAVGLIISSFLGWDVFQDPKCDVWAQ